MMSESAVQHIPEETLEQYCMGRLSETEIEHLEDHLLVCNQCQDALTETEEFIIAVRAATQQLALEPTPESAWSRFWRSLSATPRPVFAAAACALALVVVLIPRSPSNPTVVELQAMRGPETAKQAPANSSLTLRLSLPSTQPKGQLEVQVVDTAGNLVAKAQAQREGGLAVAQVKGLPAGTYWTRLYAGEEMIGEYGLNVR